MNLCTFTVGVAVIAGVVLQLSLLAHVLHVF